MNKFKELNVNTTSSPKKDDAIADSIKFKGQDGIDMSADTDSTIATKN